MFFYYQFRFRAALHGQLTFALCVLCRSKAWNRNSTCVITLFASCEMALSMGGGVGDTQTMFLRDVLPVSFSRIDGEND